MLSNSSNTFDADAFMHGHEWAKWSDCREMVEEAYYLGQKAALAQAECCGNPLRGCMDCPPHKLTFEEWAVSEGYGYWYGKGKMQWSAGSRWPEELLRRVWQAAQENK